MKHFDNKYFQKFNYSDEQVQLFFHNAKRDYEIAQKASDPNIVYRIGYDAIIKLGIAFVAKNGYKVRSIRGHHMKIIEKLGEILLLNDEIYYLDRVRRQRNIDLYDGGIDFSSKDSNDLLRVINIIFSHIS